MVSLGFMLGLMLFLNLLVVVMGFLLLKRIGDEVIILERNCFLEGIDMRLLF